MNRPTLHCEVDHTSGSNFVRLEAAGWRSREWETPTDLILVEILDRRSGGFKDTVIDSLDDACCNEVDQGFERDGLSTVFYGTDLG